MGKQFNFVKILEKKKIFGQRKFPIQLFVTKIILVQIWLGQNYFWSNKILGPKTCRSQNIWSKILLCPKRIWVQKVFRSLIILGPKKVFRQKKLDPKNSELELSWLDLSWVNLTSLDLTSWLDLTFLNCPVLIGPVPTWPVLTWPLNFPEIGS